MWIKASFVQPICIKLVSHSKWIESVKHPAKGGRAMAPAREYSPRTVLALLYVHDHEKMVSCQTCTCIDITMEQDALPFSKLDNLTEQARSPLNGKELSYVAAMLGLLVN